MRGHAVRERAQLSAAAGVFVTLMAIMWGVGIAHAASEAALTPPAAPASAPATAALVASAPTAALAKSREGRERHAGTFWQGAVGKGADSPGWNVWLSASPAPRRRPRTRSPSPRPSPARPTTTVHWAARCGASRAVTRPSGASCGASVRMASTATVSPSPARAVRCPARSPPMARPPPAHGAMAAAASPSPSSAPHATRR